MSKEPKKKKRFRSFKFNPTPEDIKKIQTIAGYGLPIEKIAAVFDISKECFEDTQKRIPELKDAVLKGRSVAEAQVTQTAFQMAVSGKNPTMTIFWLKCRARWNDQHSIKITQETVDESGEVKTEEKKLPALVIDLSGKYSSSGEN